MTRSVLAAVLALTAIVLSPHAADAQGKGKGNAFGHGKKGGSGGAGSSGITAGPSASGAAAVQPDGDGVRNFGLWLDDATTIAPGSGYMSVGVGYWRTPGVNEVDVPTFDVGLGVARRFQIGASVPVYHASEPGGPVARGMGDWCLSSKIQIVEPRGGAQPRLGFSISPLLEVRSVALDVDPTRVSWALPGSIELQREGWRTYGSVGYFSRGSLFASGAVEVAVSERAWITGTLSQSRSVKRDDLSHTLGLAKVRTDVSGGAALAVSNVMAVYGSVGRTLSRRDPNSTTFFVTGGVSIGFAARQP